MSGLTPLIEKYREQKQKIGSDIVLLFRVGDFYETFYDDAERLNKSFGVKLQKRDGVAMAGIPYHELDGFMRKLVRAGVRAAISEMEHAPSSTPTAPTMIDAIDERIRIEQQYPGHIAHALTVRGKSKRWNVLAWVVTQSSNHGTHWKSRVTGCTDIIVIANGQKNVNKIPADTLPVFVANEIDYLYSRVHESAFKDGTTSIWHDYLDEAMGVECLAEHGGRDPTFLISEESADIVHAAKELMHGGRYTPLQRTIENVCLRQCKGGGAIIATDGMLLMMHRTKKIGRSCGKDLLVDRLTWQVTQRNEASPVTVTLTDDRVVLKRGTTTSFSTADTLSFPGKITDAHTGKVSASVTVRPELLMRLVQSLLPGRPVTIHVSQPDKPVVFTQDESLGMLMPYKNHGGDVDEELAQQLEYFTDM